jgi:RNA polymerase sigma-70 factor, ECF subfamily
MHVSDPLLAEQLARGDQAAVAELYDRYGSIAYGLAHHVTRRDELADTVVRRAFAVVWRDASEAGAAAPTLFAWVIAVTHREAVAAARAARARGSNGEWPPVLPIVGGGTVRVALELLPGRDREVIDRCYLDGFREPELARHRDLPRTTIQTRARSAIVALQTNLARYPVPHDQAFERTGS